MDAQINSAPNELARKAVHIAFGFVAFSLAWLTTWQAALMALAAFVFNWKILPRVGGASIARESRGTDLGILLYPLAVLAVILAFPNRPEIAAATWGVVAFGDGMATVAGKLMPLAALPWNRRKSAGGFLAFILFGGAAAFILWRYVAETIPANLMIIVALGTIAAAVAESLELFIDDNIVVPVTSALAFVYLLQFDALAILLPAMSDRITLGVNLLLAVLAYLARSVNVSGMLGGVLIGTMLILFGGWELYILLIVFFVLGTGTTKLGYRAKAARGLAQEEGGRRGFSHAWSNSGVAAMLAVAAAFSTRVELLWIGAAASLATAAADTVASEIGQLLGRRAFLPLTFRRVETGTEGAISVEGTVAGAVAAAILASVAAWAFGQRFGVEQHAYSPISIFVAVTIAAIAGSYIESLAGSYNRRNGSLIPNGALNFFNTAVGAIIAMGLLTSAIMQMGL